MSEGLGLGDPGEAGKAGEAVARLEATVRGRVQGVGFRVYIRRRASSLGLDGWVANQPDGSVQVVAEGPETDLQELLGILERGPAGAVVEAVDVQRGEARGEQPGFGVRAGHHGGD